jgi:hypothetical protein
MICYIEVPFIQGRIQEKIKTFWRKIVIFHKKYPTNFRATLRPAQFF